MPLAPTKFTATIANGVATSGVINMIGSKILALQVPTIDSGTLKLQGSHDGTNFFDLKDTTPATLQFAASTGAFWMDGDYLARFMGIPYLQLVTSVNQTALRTFTIVVARE